MVMLTQNEMTTDMANAAADVASARGSPALSPQTTAIQHAGVVEKGEEVGDDDEMPLLFMDGLPSDFQRNAQLAAIASFMDDSDADDADADVAKRRDASDSEDAGDDRGYSRSSSRRQEKRNAARNARKQAPYAQTKKESKASSQSAKELQLYLSMFKM